MYNLPPHSGSPTYQHTAQYEGRYFHRLELGGVDSSSVALGCTKKITSRLRCIRLQPLKAYSEDSSKPLATIKRFGISKSSFYYALNWKKKNPGKKWGSEVIRARGKVTLLTPDMKTELFHWIALSQRSNGGVDRETCCRVAYWLPVQALLGTGSTGAVPAVFVLIFKGEGDFS